MRGAADLPEDPAGLARLAETALANGTEAEAVDLVAAGAARIGTDARLWHLSALLNRMLYRQADALAAFDRAAALVPGDAGIAQGRAYAVLEAGLDATAAFEAARRLNPTSSDVLLGQAAARYAQGQGAAAVAGLETMLAQSPGWVAGHAGLARLHALMGEPDAVTASFERALAAWPRDPALWHALAATLIQGERFAEAQRAIDRARGVLGGAPFLDPLDAVARSELGDEAAADLLFARLAPQEDAALATRRVRHLLRYGRVDEALPAIDRWADPASPLIWPYAALAWRLAGDPRWAWLEGDPRLVSVIDLTDRLPPLDRLAAVLRAMHPNGGQPLDQSVRGGTQTDGILFTRIDPLIGQLRDAVAAAVRNHIAQLPPPDPAHPILRQPRDRPLRFAGAWSVRLASGGHHSNHVHPLGWFSSALYIALPDGEPGALTLGEPPAELGLDLSPLRVIPPKPGQLVLFPSTLWHGTRPFASGERLTIAFDIAPTC